MSLLDPWEILDVLTRQGSRRAGAPRLIEWTGERCVPWAPDPQVVIEHLQRYAWAAALVEDRRVLDLASGEGFGAAMLATRAASVLGVDVDERTVQHARLNYSAANLGFEVGTALDLRGLEDASFDVVVAFEVLEHVSEHDRLLDEVRRVLAPDGLLVLSTPDRQVYSDHLQRANPFHELEVSEEELRELLGRRFSGLRVLGQRPVSGAHLGGIDGGEPGRTVFATPQGDEWRLAEDAVPVYLVCLASDAPLPEAPGDFVLADPGLAMVHRAEEGVRQGLRAAEEEASRLREAAAAHAREAGSERSLRQSLEVRLDRAQRDVIDARRGEERRTAAMQAEVEAVRAGSAEEARELRRIRASVTWRGVERVKRGLMLLLGGPGSPLVRGMQAGLRAVGSRRGPPAGAPPRSARERGPIRFPALEDPVVSLVVTAYTGAETTERTLRAILAATGGPAYEVIVIDDAGDRDNLELWDVVEGARIHVNDENLGYLRSTNAGAALARGRYVVLCNNDIEPREGWLDALVARAESHPEIGAVAPKLLYPDGTLQEAGGIVFADGSAWNYGRGLQGHAPECSFAREVDYGSAACLLVRADLWREIGGFDERYAPMYYEDTDLCFEVRRHGRRVMFEPRAEVVHHEGSTAGTDVASGHKAWQDRNQPKFAEKWRAELREQHRRSPAIVRRAASRAPGPNVLVVDHRVPTLDRDSGSLRMHQLLEQLLDMGCRVTLVPDDFNPMQPYTRDLQAAGVEVLYGPVDLGSHLVDLAPTLRLAILSRPYIAAQHVHVLREHAPAATIAYDTVDLHFVREQRRAALGEQAAHAKAASMKEIELALVRATDATLVVTEEERAQILELVADARVLVVPNANEVAPDEATPGHAGRSGLLFVGGFQHTPNVDAARHLVEDVMPLVWRELPDVRVTIVGPDAPESVVRLASQRVDVAGWVPDLTPLLRESLVMVAPLRYGAGMKGKVTQSMAAGLPVVTTPTGAEGLDAVEGRDVLVGNGPEELARAIVELTGDAGLWHELSANGKALVERVCSPAVMRSRLDELLALEPRRAGT